MNWDQRYIDEDIPWDIGRPHALWVNYLNTVQIKAPIGVPACGRGHDVHAAAIAGYETWGWDISSTAIEWAKDHYSHRRAFFEKRDLFTLHSDWEGKFGTIWEWNCFCAFPPEKRQAYLRSILHLLKPHGHLVGIFRVGPEDQKQEQPPYRVSETNLENLLSPFFDLNFIKILDDQDDSDELSWRVYRCRI